MSFIKRITIVTAIAILLWSLSAWSGPYISIEGINTVSDFPQITIFLTVHSMNSVDVHLLDKNNFQVFEDDYRADDLSLSGRNGTENLLYLVISIDSSKSISQKFLSSIKSAARNIVDSSGPKDKIALYRFNDSVQLLNDFSQSKQEIIRNINAIERHGKRTLLYNAIYDSIDILGKVQKKRKKIIVFTDGKDEGSSVEVEEIIQFARDEDIPVYFICLKSAKCINKLARISKLTGGKLVYSDTSKDVSGMYNAIISVINNRYKIQYQSRLKPDGKNHQVEVRFKYKNVRDRTSASFLLTRGFSFISRLTSNTMILVGIIIFLFILLILTIFYFLKRENRRLRRSLGAENKVSQMEEILNRAISIEEKERLNEIEVLSALDPDYKYANAWLFEKDGPEAGRKYPIYWNEVTIGRSRENTIVVADRSVSARHAKIKSVRGVYHLFDMVSDNGTFLNGKKLLRPKSLYDWDEIKLGRTLFVFRGSKRPL